MRRRRRSRSWIGLPLGLAVLIGAAVAIAVVATSGGSQRQVRATRTPAGLSHPPRTANGGALPATPPGISLPSGPNAVTVHLHPKPAAALLFDFDSGRVLWRLHPLRVLPIASVTKMMTALLVSERLPPNAKALIGKDALRYTGSEVGVLPRGKRVPIRTLLYGLLLPSGNDAAVALADRVSGSDRKFARLMNLRARQLGLRCTHYTSSYGLQKGNRSCPADLASLARVVMRQPRIAKIVRHRRAHIYFPWLKGHHLDLYSTNPLLALHYPGTIGLKTGFTDPAGHCLVAVVRRGSRTLGAVLLNSPNTGAQAMQLFDAAFRSPAG